MAVRVRFGDVVLEVDTVDEALHVARALSAGTSRQSTETEPRSHQPARPVRSRHPRNSQNPSLLGRTPPARVVFKNGHYPAVEALREREVTSEDLVNLLALPGARSIPPTVAAWGKRAKSINLNLDDLLQVDRGYLHGKPHTVYRLTALGRETFAPETDGAQAENGMGPRDVG